MKKEYKAPVMSKVIMEVESHVMVGSKNDNDWGQSKENGRVYEDEEPAAPKKFWDDEN
ncbi:MAG: hypothetical protein II812_01250 [Prevotella sp.]|nr:hypothetical protein [Prevotella sp.]